MIVQRAHNMGFAAHCVRPNASHFAKSENGATLRKKAQ